MSRKPKVRKLASVRFWEKVAVDQPETCWPWIAGLDRHGYGVFTHNGRNVRAHLWAYLALVGPIADGLVIDHLCRVRHCVNPEHLEPVTNRVNIQRGRAGHPSTNVMALRTYCQGHPYDEANTLHQVLPDGRRRRLCRECRRVVNHRYYHQKKSR